MSNKLDNYMFFSNIKQMISQLEDMLYIDPNLIDHLLNNGHDWADDHITVAKENIDQVFDFINNEIPRSPIDESNILDFSNYKKQILEKKSNHPKIYKAPEGSKRDNKLDKAQELLKKGKKKEAYSLRDKMEQEEREKLNEEKNGNLSKETEDKIRKVADEKGYTFSSLKQEYIKGLGAFYSSGSRPGMTAHQWAMARVNKATPSKSWANVKKKKVNEDIISGGNADMMSLEDIANRHNVSVEDIKAELKLGMKDEMEHTSDIEVAKEIAKDHIFNNPKFYSESELNEGIEKVGDDWVVYSKKKVKGKRQRLGTHKTKKAALKQLRAIEISKAGR